MILIVLIGGVGNPVGPAIGVVAFRVIADQLGNQDTWRFIILGSVAAAMTVAAPNGIYGQLQRLRSFELFPVARRLVGADRGGDTKGQGG